MSRYQFLYIAVYEDAKFTASLPALAINTLFFPHYQFYMHIGPCFFMFLIKVISFIQWSNVFLLLPIENIIFFNFLFSVENSDKYLLLVKSVSILRLLTFCLSSIRVFTCCKSFPDEASCFLIHHMMVLCIRPCIQTV